MRILDSLLDFKLIFVSSKYTIRTDSLEDLLAKISSLQSKCVLIFVQGKLLITDLSPFFKDAFYVALHKKKWVLFLCPKAYKKVYKKGDNRQTQADE